MRIKDKILITGLMLVVAVSLLGLMSCNLWGGNVSPVHLTETRAAEYVGQFATAHAEGGSFFETPTPQGNE